MARLNTTTYQNRNIPHFVKLKSYVDFDVNKILEVGPGGILKMFSGALGSSRKGRFLKLIEQPLRRIPFLKIESFEPFEICETFKDSSPELTVLDIHKRILNSIVEKNSGQYNIAVDLHSIADSPYKEGSFDVAICHAVINWESQDYKAMIDNLFASVRPGGLVFIATKFVDYLESKPDIIKLDEWIYKKSS